MRALLALAAATLLPSTARAEEPWYGGEHGVNRVAHLSITVVGIALYPALEFAEDGVDCRFCGPPNRLDRATRHALVWSPHRRRLASRLSDVTGYIITPGLAVGLVLPGTVAERSWARVIDDITPIAESMMITQWLTRATKIAIGRRRPYAFYTGGRDEDDNLSMPSGHTSRAFALATSAGMIARKRGYRAEPYIWATGLTFAVATGYLRIAADQHYLTDVLVGAALGVTAGLTVPFLMRRSDVEAVPSATGLSIAGAW